MTRPAHLRLLWSPKSPFVRKVMIYAHELGVADQIELVRTVATPQGVPNADIIEHNPLGQIPTLLVDGRDPIMGSGLICNWLANYASVPQLEGEDWLKDERWQVLADGLTANLLQIRFLHLASPTVNAELLISLKAKVRACLDHFETVCGTMEQSPFGVGQAAMVCALGQLDFRFPQSGWTAHYVNLANWQARQNTRPSVAANPIIDDQNTPFISISLPFGKE